jgi:ribonuclease R
VRVLAEMLAPHGIDVDPEDAVTPIGMKRVLDQIVDKASARSLSFLVLRTLKQAVWDTTPVGHFGLASLEYLHFTSPIRRYPDLLVHRLLKYYLSKDGQPSGGGYRKPPPTTERLTELAVASSQHERRAMEAEREAVAMYRAYLMRDQVGERYTGTISAVTSFGAFVEIDEPFVEGLIKLEAVGDDMVFDEIHMTLRGRRSGLTLTLGDAVTVEIQDVSVPKRRINLLLIQGGKVVQGPAPDPAPPRIGLLQRKASGRAVEKAALGAVEKGAPRRKGGLQLKVSHRGPGDGKRGKPKRR